MNEYEHLRRLAEEQADGEDMDEDSGPVMKM
mgnify:FL=1